MRSLRDVPAVEVGATAGGRDGYGIQGGRLLGCEPYADVAQLVEHHLAKVRVAGSNPVVRSSRSRR